MARAGLLLRIAVGLLVLASWPAEAADGRRLALVLGNGAYVHAPPLPNPPRDARAVAHAFRRLGFDVVEGIDLARAGLVGALRDFGRRAEGAELAIVYFAGHGIQVKGQNFILPVDAQLQREQDLGYEAIGVNAVLDEAGAARRLRLVILDACRDNPFVARLQREMGATRSTSVGRGLKVMDTITPDTLIAYATTADAVAEDGTGEHSPYTSALLEHLETPGLELNLLFGRVRDAVMRRTSNRQQPFTYGSLGGEPILLKPAETPPRPAAAAAPGGDVVELAFWDSIKQSTSAADYGAYLEAFPAGRFAPLARARLAAANATEAAPRPAPAAAPEAVAPAAPRAAPASAAPPPLPASKPEPPARAAAPQPAPPPAPEARPAPPERVAAVVPPPEPPLPARQQEARVPPAPAPAELRACPPAGSRLGLSVGAVLNFGTGKDFVCDIGLGIPDRQMLSFVAGPDPRQLRWQGPTPKLPLAAGHRFAFISEGMGDGGPSAWYHDFRVTGPARTRTRAGEFDVLVIEERRTGWNGNEYDARLRHHWSIALGFVVKQELLEETSNRANFRNVHNRGGPAYGPLGRQSWEAVSLTQP
jgi:uncharacterized caspase-like protein